jgi:uncharacterized protein (TIGR02597 family)
MSKITLVLTPSPKTPASRTLLAAVALLGGFFVGGSAALAQSVVTTPVGAMTYTFPATTQVTTTYISIPLTNPSVYSGPVASLTANTITFSGTPFVLGGLAQAGEPFFARIATGPQAGRTMLVTGNTENSITVDTTDNSSQTTALNLHGWSLAAGNLVEIIVGDTLSSIFGDGSESSPLVFQGGTSGLNADTISFYNKQTSAFDIHFFSTGLGYWRNIRSSASTNNLVIYPEDGMTITRRANRPLRVLPIIGEVKTVTPLLKNTGSVQTIFASTTHPVDLTLAQLNLQNWTQSNSALSADTITIANPITSAHQIYFRRLDGSWRRVGGGTTDQSNVLIPAGTSFSLTKRAAVSGSSSFISIPLPYSL